jgi:hypothetical protein
MRSLHQPRSAPVLGKDQYLKIICADPNHVPSAAKPRAEHIVRGQP